MRFVLFTDNLADLSTSQACASAKAAGFDGLDLTLRPGGHVRPENSEMGLRDTKLPNADVTVGLRSAALVHLANIAARVGRVLQFDPQTETIVGDDEANILLSRPYRQGHWAAPRLGSSSSGIKSATSVPNAREWRLK